MSEQGSSSTPAPDGASSSSSGQGGSTTVEVTVKTLDDREVRVSVGSNHPVQSIIDKARAALRITTGTNQRVIFSGRVLDSTMTVLAAGITNGQTVHLVERGRSVANDRPNVSHHQPRFAHIAPPPMMVQRMFNPTPMFEGITPAVMSPQGVTIMHPVRVPPQIGGVPSIMSKYAEDIITQKALPGRSRPGPLQFQEVRGATSQFLLDPHYIQWGVRLVDGKIFQPREKVDQMIRSVLTELDYLSPIARASIGIRWDHNRTALTISFPEIPAHVPSPALEKLDFLALWTEHITKVLDKLVEHDGLVSAVRRVLEMVNANQAVENLSEPGVTQRLAALDDIIRELELMWADLSHQKDYERQRFHKPQNQSEQYYSRKFEEHLRSTRNPLFVMRHALDVDFLEVSREFRQQRLRFAELENLLDDVIESGALKFVRDTMLLDIDYRYRALSMYTCYMQRLRHQISHMTHLCADFDLSFIVPDNPQRLLPNHAINLLQVPFPHCGTLLLKFETPQVDDDQFDIPITNVVEPPRVLADLTGRCNGDHPYLAYNPPSVHMESVQQPARRVEQTGNRRTTTTIHHPPPPPQFMQNPTPGAFNFFPTPQGQDPTNTFLSWLAAYAEDPENLANVQVSMGRPQRRFVTTTGDAPSIPVETQPPPGAPPSERRYTTHRFNVHPDQPGPSTETLAPMPVQIEPSELQRIARNVATRYRAEALQRIAANLSAKFSDESWDTRIQNMPICTLRECIAIALELLASSGTTVIESRELMLSLVRDEEVLVRAIAECVKSLFGRGEFPTHVSRIIMPRAEAASSRSDYESVDHVDDAQSDDYDGMIVRVPSDISQPQSGDLRAIRERRQSRRQFLENRGRIPSTSSVASTSSTPPGPSFNSEDAAEIRAGRLPLGNRPTSSRRPATPVARGESPNHGGIHITFPPPQIFPGFGVPSTSQVVPPPWEAPIMPIRQVVSPTPTTRALHDFDISDTSEHNAPSTPSPPAPTPRSAPATVTSSPIHMDESEGDLNEAARQAARIARARIDHLAANFNGNLADSRRQSPFVAPTFMNDPRRVLPSAKPLVAIDPFLHCTNRHCEINRLSHPTQISELERYTVQSIRPDDEFAVHMQRFLPHGDRRPHQVSQTDEDYNYQVRRNPNGQLAFNDEEKFKKFLRTMIRSLLAHCIDADNLHTMNMNQISGYPAANHVELMKLVKDYLNSSAERRSIPHRAMWERNTVAEQNRERIENWNRQNAARTGAGVMEQLAAQATNIRAQIEAQTVAHAIQTAAAQAAATRAAEEARTNPPIPPPIPPPTFPPAPPGINMEQDVLIPGQMASLLTQLVDYLDDDANPRPPGVYGLLMELTHDRLTRHDFAQLARRSTASNVIAEYESSIRAHIRSTYLQGQTSLSDSDFQKLATKLANYEGFFNAHITRQRQYVKVVEAGGEKINPGWTFRQIEITFIKGILSLAYHEELDTAVVVEEMLLCVDNYLSRNLYLLYLLEGKNWSRVRNNIGRIGILFAQARFPNAPDHTGWGEYINRVWEPVLEYWFQKYKNLNEAACINYMQQIKKCGGKWNDVPSQPGIIVGSYPFSSGSAPSTSAAPSASGSLNNSSNRSESQWQ